MDEREHVREVYAVSAGRLVAQLYALTGDFGEAQDVVHEVAALQRLPHAVREAVVLHHLADLPVAEIAGMLGCSPSAVKARLTRGRRALSELLNEADPAADSEPRPGPPGVLGAAAVLREAHHA